MKLGLVRACAILLCTHASACGGAPFTLETLELTDADTYLANHTADSSDDPQGVGVDSSIMSEDADSSGDSSSRGPGQSPDSGFDSYSSTCLQYDGSCSDGSPNTDAGVTSCCTIVTQDSICTAGQIFPCTSSSITCSPSSGTCVLTDPSNGLCSGIVRDCK